jgi:hypothetical protein
MYKKLPLFLLSITLISLVSASDEAEWLLGQSNEGVFSNLKETSYGILALNTETGYENFVSNGSKYLIEQLTSCMASKSCNVRNAAIATVALKEIGNNANIVEDLGVWLLNSRSNVFTGDLPGADNKWFVQIISDVSGSCLLLNIETGASTTVQVDLSQGYSPWYEIGSDILTSTTKDLNLDCSSLGTNLILSLINKKSVNSIENYFIKQEEHSETNVSINFGIPCWGSSYRGTCDAETSAYVLYALDKLGKSGDPSWLVSQNDLSILENAILFKVLNDNTYFDVLVAEKNTDGFWGSGNLKLTAQIYNLLNPDPLIGGVSEWIESRRDNLGCWPKNACNVEQTALVLYSGSYQPSETGCPDLDGDEICDIEDNDIDGDGLDNNLDPFPTNPDANNNGIPDGNEDTDGDGTPDSEDEDIDGDGILNGEDIDPFDPDIGRPETRTGGTTIGEICTTEEGCQGRRSAIGDCLDVSGDGCPNIDEKDDCTVGGFCITSRGCVGEYSSTCSCVPEEGCEEDVIPPSGESGGEDDFEEDGSIWLWVFLVLLMLVALGVGGFFAYKKGLLKFKSGKNKPEAKYTPRLASRGSSPVKSYYTPRVGPRKSKKPQIVNRIESELDKSMKDLEKLLGK